MHSFIKVSRQFYLLLVSVLFSSLVLKGQDDINITYPNVGTLYSSDGNGLSIDWHYQSQSNDIQSLSWAYKLDEDFMERAQVPHKWTETTVWTDRLG